jgi:hypothetical protein
MIAVSETKIGFAIERFTANRSIFVFFAHYIGTLAKAMSFFSRFTFSVTFHIRLSKGIFTTHKTNIPPYFACNCVI